jgi:23S rRNA (adenine2503-C2)-methyltransferase
MRLMTRACRTKETGAKEDIFGKTGSFFAAFASEKSLKPFQGKELYRWIYFRRILDPDKWTSLPLSFREGFKKEFSLDLPEIKRVSESGDGTRKFLLSLKDGHEIESVCIPSNGRVTLCISAQAGCPVGCSFCLTGKMGFQRNLKVPELLGQVALLERECGLAVNSYNIVFMGMGEPLLNLGNLKEALSIMTDPDGMAISRKRITVSTIGIKSGLEEYLEDPSLPPLAISLHSASEETRKKLIPAANDFSLKEMRTLLHNASRKERDRISLEYILLKGVNDSEDDALELAKFCRGLKVKVNMIPLNPHPLIPFEAPAEQTIINFQSVLACMEISSTIRKSRGADIAAACGQLAVFERDKAK